MVTPCKRMCLLTDRFETYDCRYCDESYTVSIASVPSSGDRFFYRDLSNFDYCIIDGKSCKLNELKEILTTAHPDTYFLYMSDHLDPEEKSLLKQFGIVDVINQMSQGEIVSYIKSIESGSKISSGGFIILEDNPGRKTAINRIISRFGYTAIYANTCEEMQQCADKSNVQYILLNLGIEYRELHNFVKTYNTRVEMRRIPVISYADMSEGMFIHEVVSGLNKLTRFVLSPEELYSFLVDEMFKKDIIPLLDSLNIFLALKECSYYARESLKRIYFINEGNPFQSPGVITGDNITNMRSMLELMSASLNRINGIAWLVNNSGSECALTCGVSAAGQHLL